MPCYDKKLEAARDDFVIDFEQSEFSRTPEVDSVLTTGEVLELIQVRSLYISFLYVYNIFNINSCYMILNY